MVRSTAGSHRHLGGFTLLALRLAYVKNTRWYFAYGHIHPGAFPQRGRRQLLANGLPRNVNALLRFCYGGIGEGGPDLSALDSELSPGPYSARQLGREFHRSRAIR